MKGTHGNTARGASSPIRIIQWLHLGDNWGEVYVPATRERGLALMGRLEEM